MKKVEMKIKKFDKNRTYCEKHDAYFDVLTGEWLERACPDKECGFCSKRPTKHKPHKWEYIDGIKRVCGENKNFK
jgi:nitrite reductase/ring-hydroxylating ferredoxin subunit